MDKRQVELFYHDYTSAAPQDTETMFEQVLLHLLETLKARRQYTVSVSIVGEETIREVNCQYRHKDRPTDVISFAYQESDVMDLPITDLGEIMICLEVAKRQAVDFKHPLKREMAFLLIHGLLHLWGYDHIEETEASEMYALQNEILNSFIYDYESEGRKNDQ